MPVSVVITRVLPAESVPLKVIGAPAIPFPSSVVRKPNALIRGMGERALATSKVRIVGTVMCVVNPEEPELGDRGEDGGEDPELEGFGPAEPDSSSVI